MFRSGFTITVCKVLSSLSYVKTLLKCSGSYAHHTIDDRINYVRSSWLLNSESNNLLVA